MSQRFLRFGYVVFTDFVPPRFVSVANKSGWYCNREVFVYRRVRRGIESIEGI